MKISLCMFSHLPFHSYPKLLPQPRQRNKINYEELHWALGQKISLPPPPSHPCLSGLTSMKQKMLCHEGLKKTLRWN